MKRLFRPQPAQMYVLKSSWCGFLVELASRGAEMTGASGSADTVAFSEALGGE